MSKITNDAYEAAYSAAREREIAYRLVVETNLAYNAACDAYIIAVERDVRAEREYADARRAEIMRVADSNDDDWARFLGAGK